MSGDVEPGVTSGHHVSAHPSKVDLRAANLSFIPDDSPALAPIDETLFREISEHRRQLFQDFERQVVTPFAERLALLDASGVVKVAGSYFNPAARVRLSSDVDMVVLSPELKSPEKYLNALLELSHLARKWRQGIKERTGIQVEPYFFTRAITEEDKFSLVEAATGCEERNILPCHFLYYRDEKELIKREEDLGRRLLSCSRSVISRRGNTDAVFKADSSQKLTALETIPWNIERAVAEFVLNQSLVPPKLIVRSYANQIFNVVRNLADILPISEDQKTVTNILQLLDPDRRDGLVKRFKPIEALRMGAPIGEKAPLLELLLPAVEILRAINQYIENPN